MSEIQDQILDKDTRVTFLILTYNQRSFVTDALEAAFAQEYPNLEIYISDDCSTDGTYELLTDIVNGYTGTHKIVLTKNPENYGLLKNFFSAIQKCSGDYIIAAAGDDISYPYRTQECIAPMQKNKLIYATCSAVDIIDQRSENLRKNYRFWDGQSSPYSVISPNKSGGHKQINGAAAAYSRRLFDLIDFQLDGNHSEDEFLSHIICLIGGQIQYIDNSLVGYRRHDAALVNTPNSYSSLQDKEMSFVKSAMNRVSLIKNLIQFAQRRSLNINLTEKKIIDDIYRYNVVVMWETMNFPQRVRCIVESLRQKNIGSAKWSAARLIGHSYSYFPLKYLRL
jgi:glycosyltransferase involved in cell wall biosynthesis